MAAKSTVPCDQCSAKGVVPRERRKIEDGKPDPFDVQFEELCPKCSGSGRMLAGPPPATG